MTRAASRACTLIISAGIALGGCGHPRTADEAQVESLEVIYVLRSIREPHTAGTEWCASTRTGFAPFLVDAERKFSFWSLETRARDGRIIDAKRAQVAQLRACLGPTSEPARQNFYAEVRLDGIAMQGTGECLALMVDFPEAGLVPVRCHLILTGMPAPFVGGLLTTSTMTSRSDIGSVSEPAGYMQASIATIRLWKARATR